MTRSIDDRSRRRLHEQVPMKRLGQPEDVASAVLFLAVPEGGYITGATLNVNGGMYM
jgi:3-oxoacyl-[acyl-carrier protein] reductase